jgi:hypothetical protein
MDSSSAQSFYGEIVVTDLGAKQPSICVNADHNLAGLLYSVIKTGASPPPSSLELQAF